MASVYHLSGARRAVNLVMRNLIRVGLGGRHTYLLTVPGRSSGRAYSTPVTLVENAEGRWLVAPYGERSWVKNARAAGQVQLSRARRREHLRVEEVVAPGEAAVVLREYLRAVSVTRPFFDAKAGDPVEAFEREASRHPVFRLTPAR